MSLRSRIGYQESVGTRDARLVGHPNNLDERIPQLTFRHTRDGPTNKPIARLFMV
jgi:hypothetical protein